MENTFPHVALTYNPDGYAGFKYSKRHAAYTNNLTRLEQLPAPSPPSSTLPSEREKTYIRTRTASLEQGHVNDVVAKLIESAGPSDVSKVRALWHWLTAQNVHETVYRLTVDFDEVEYQLQRLKNEARNEGSTYAALFALLCGYANIICVLIHGYVKGSLYKIGKPLDRDHMAEWNAVFVDGSWRLLDPFWGSCVKNQEGHVTSNTSDWFLFTEPKQFLYSHLPEKPEWQLVEQPISKHEFEKQAYLKERYFELGMLDLLMPNTCLQETSNGEISIQLPLQANRADSQQFECITNLLTDGDEWVHVQPSRGQSDFKYLLEDKTLSLHVRFERKGLYQVEIIGKEESSNEPDLNEFEWVVIYQVEVKGLPERVIMFPTEESIGWGPGRKVTEIGLEILSHKEGMIRFYPNDELVVKFRRLEGYTYHKFLLKGNFTLKNRELFHKPTDNGDEDDWYTKDRDGIIAVRVNLTVSAEYMLQILAKVNGRYIGSICNYLIVCDGELTDQVLEEVKQLRERLRKATERRNLYELRRISEQIKSRYLQLHPLMRDSYRQASHVIQELQQREDIRRKLGNLDMKTVISELSRYNQLPGGDVMAVMQAMFVLLGVREQDVKTWDKLRQHLNTIEARESLRVRLQQLQNDISGFVQDKRNREVVKRADRLLRNIRTEEMEGVALAIVPLLEMIKGIISEYERENQLEYERTQTTMIAQEANPNTFPHPGATPTTSIEENQTSEAEKILTPVETSSLVHSISMVETPLSPNFEENDSVLSLPE